MAMPLELTRPVEEESAEGLSAEDRAALLIHIATALTGEARDTPFGGPVRAFLKRNQINPDQLSDVLDGLIAICAREPDAWPRLMAWRANQPIAEPGRSRPVEVLLDWREDRVHRPNQTDSEGTLELATNEFPPLEQLITPKPRDYWLGKYTFSGHGTEEFMREKQAEIEWEDR